MKNLGKVFYQDYFAELGQGYALFEELPESASERERNVNKIEKEKLGEALQKFAEKTLFQEALSYRQEMTPGTHSFELTTDYPGLLIGSGYNHEVNLKGELILGFFFDYTTGLPCLPGSSIKGVLRHAFEAVEGRYVLDILKTITGDEKYTLTNVKSLIAQIFEGKESAKEGSEYLPASKRDIFYDAFPVKSNHPQKLLLGSDYITPHHPEDEEMGQFKAPIPLQFLKVLPNVVFQFNFKLTDAQLTNSIKIEAAIKEKLLQQILVDQGIGAKTNVGYGQFKPLVESLQAPIKSKPNYYGDKRLRVGELIEGEIVEMGNQKNVKLFITEGNSPIISIKYGSSGFSEEDNGKICILKINSVKGNPRKKPKLDEEGIVFLRFKD